MHRVEECGKRRGRDTLGLGLGLSVVGAGCIILCLLATTGSPGNCCRTSSRRGSTAGACGCSCNLILGLVGDLTFVGGGLAGTALFNSSSPSVAVYFRIKRFFFVAFMAVSAASSRSLLTYENRALKAWYLACSRAW